MFKKRLDIKIQIIIMVVFCSLSIIAIDIYILINTKNEQTVNIQNDLENSVLQINNDVQIYGKEIELVVDKLFSSVTIQRYLTTEDKEERFKISQYLQDVVNLNTYGNINILNIRIIQDGYRLVSAGSSIQNSVFYKANRDYGLFDLLPNTKFYTKAYQDEADSKYYIAYVRPVTMKTIQVEQNQKQLFFVLCRIDSIQDHLLGIVSILPETNILITDYDGTIILSNQKSQIGHPVSEYSAVLGSDNLISKKTIEETNWVAYAAVPAHLAWHRGFQLMKSNFVLSIISISAIIILGILTIKKLTAPIAKLNKDISSVSSNDYIFGPSSYGLVEVDAIAGYIEQMLDRIAQTNSELLNAHQQLHQLQLSKKEAEAAFYRAQINPHFLYNTLECIRSIGFIHHIPEIQIISSSMAKIFRYSIKGNDIVKVSDEIDCAIEYINIMNIRFVNRFKLEIDIPEDLMKIGMPKMVIQPLVENSIQHGLEALPEGGYIILRGSRQNNSWVLNVEDNGKGITEEELHYINQYLRNVTFDSDSYRKRYGIALNNINTRIRMDFGDEYGIKIESINHVGTIVSVCLPVLPL